MAYPVHTDMGCGGARAGMEYFLKQSPRKTKGKRDRSRRSRSKRRKK